MKRIDRRRFLTISAAAMAVPSTISASTNARWAGRALGGPVSMQLVGISDIDAAPIFAAVETELDRLEQIFSLYREHSELTRLNREGVLSNPAPELLAVLSLCSALHSASDGVFDASIQPLWQAIALNKNTKTIADAKTRIGWNKVHFDTRSVRLPKGGALTLNGVAQGAVTDAITTLLKARGLRDILVDMGEIAAIGNGPRGPWSVGVGLPDGAVVHRLTLTDRAVATSVPSAMEIGNGLGHILTPDGQIAKAGIASVSAPRAVVADGLSTALCLVSNSNAAELIGKFDHARIEHFA